MRAIGRQKGVALITVLLVFALVAVLAAAMLRRGQLNLRSVGNLVDTRQGYYYALAGEAFARQMLARQALQQTGQDKLTQAWAKTAQQQPFAIDQGTLTVAISDLQGRFNLNTLVDDNGLAVTDASAQFQRLLSALGLDSRYVSEWQDWIDKDQRRQANGAEDADYTDYLTANAREADISALRLLHSMKPEDYALLAPHVTVLPVSTSINVNTADASVLRSLSPIITDAVAAQVIARQQAEGYDDAATFTQAAGLSAAAQTVPTVEVASSYFEVLVTVVYDERWQRLRTVLRRDINGSKVTFTVLSRTRSPLIDDIQL